MSLEDVTLKVTVTVPPGAMVDGETVMLFALGGVGVSAEEGLTNTPEIRIANMKPYLKRRLITSVIYQYPST